MVRESTLRGHLEGDARRDIGLDEPGDHIDRRPLGRKDQMDAGGARLLRQARDQLLDFLADDHHQIGEFVDDHDDERQRRQIRDVLRDDARNALRDLLHADRILDRVARFRRILDLAVEAADVAHAEHAT